MISKSRSGTVVWAVILAACNSELTAPALAACRSGVAPLVLNVGQYTAVDPGPTEGCVVFPANASTTDSAEYLLVPQVTTESPDFRSSFKLAGALGAMAAPPVAALVQGASLPPAERFHRMLREMERTRTYPAPSEAPGARTPTIALTSGMDTLGNVRPFLVLASIHGSPLVSVVATAQSVGQHIALYVDNAAPTNGLSPADYDKVRADFDTLLYAVDRAAFGAESDIDGNGLVLVLMTNAVNKLVTRQECRDSGYVAGYFYGLDIDPRATSSQGNHAEIFYSIVADPDSTLSCPHPISQVKRVIPVTFIHEFQHMISYYQHVVRGGSGELPWLNEGMSHYAEELGGRAILAGTGGMDSVRFCDHVRGDLYNLGLYWSNPGAYALVETIGTGALAERGAQWLFVRYLVDRFAADTTLAAAAALTRQIDQTSLTGPANVAAVTGQAFAQTVEEWALASWVADLQGFTAPAALRYKRWAFRAGYPQMSAKCNPNNQPKLPASFPLGALAGAGSSINVSGTMWAGSGAAYLRALQGPGGAGFTLLFSDAKGVQLAPKLVPRLNVLRIR